MVTTCASMGFYADHNARREAIERVSSLDESRLRNIAKSSLTEKIFGHYIPFTAVPYSEKSSQRHQDIEVSRDILKYKTRDPDKLASGNFDHTKNEERRAAATFAMVFTSSALISLGACVGILNKEVPYKMLGTGLALGALSTQVYKGNRDYLKS